ncbi:MAG: AbrB/MazE/SpoVT family DNA-binding domain-containing protein [Nitrosopumilaceae archaeon]|nr:AbrB/MazE/SpoVT family DNA-binding domain-containing protein [Nitrosopumilaceae archaeon]
MPITLNGSVMKVGNSHVLVLPRPVLDNYDIKKGDSLDLIITDKGIYIPLTQKKLVKNKELEKILKTLENK